MWGEKLKISIFGESHGAAIGVTIDGLPSGFRPNFEAVSREMARRAPRGGDFSTPRKENDDVKIVSGLFNGATTGTPLCALIVNSDTKSGDYNAGIMRPGHSDYGIFVKSGGYNDFRGGGHSSGRLTAPLVFCGALCKQLLDVRGIRIYARLAELGGVMDETKFPCGEAIMRSLADKPLPIIDDDAAQSMTEAVRTARSEGDSVGGVIECVALGVPVGVGEPFFDSLESRISQLIFSVPAVKGIEFGAGYAMARMRGSTANDPMRLKDGEVVCTSNNNGGVIGGVSNGMPIVFDVAIKPTPSIFKEQESVDLIRGREIDLKIKGRHDPCVAVRAVPVVEAVAAIAVYDLLRG